MDEVVIERRGALGVLRLNRPQALNTLTVEMIATLHRALRNWAKDDSVAAVWLEGAGDKGLCAGADVRRLRDSVVTGTAEARDFLLTEYALNGYVATYPKPYVAWMDGIVMGGGLGLSAHGKLRLVTPRTRAAMPETIIGMFPDVGLLYELSRAPGELGAHLALTGDSFTGADAIALGIADALVEVESKATIMARLAAGDVPDGTEFGDPPPSPLAAERGWIDQCYTGVDVAAILARLLRRPEPAAHAAAEAIGRRSPLALAVTLAALRRAATLPDVEAVLEQDAALVLDTVAAPDFAEGVRALLIDKDRDPRWAPLDGARVAGILAALN